MSITVHRALFGQDPAHGQGFALLGTTHPDKGLVRRIFNSADLSENAPSQLSWQPALRGLPWEDFYLLLRTFADPSPQVRGGRVYSHVLLLSLDQLAQFPNLQPLLAALPADAPKQVPMTAAEIWPAPAPPLVLTPRLGYLLHEVVHTPRPSVLVWAGQAGFDEAAALTWQVLGTAERQQLRLSLGFLPGYQRAPTDSLTLVVVPDSLLQRWRSVSRVIEATAAYTTLDEAEAWLAGLPQQSPNLSLLLAELNADILSISDLDALQRVAPTATVLSTASLRDVIALATLLHQYPTTQSAYRQRVLARLRQIVATSPPHEVQRLGSVQEEMLSTADLRQLAGAVHERFVELAAQVSSAELLPALVSWHDAPDRAWWQQSVRATLTDVFAFGSPAAARLVFDLWQQAAEVTTAYLKLLPSTASTEAMLLRELPAQMPATAWQNGLNLARSRRWLRLHMYCLLALYPLPKALTKQLALDTEPAYLAALEVAASQAAAADFVAATVVLDERRLTTLAGTLCAQKPQLLKKLIVEQPGWQAVWLAAAQISGNVWANIAAPTLKVTQLLDLLRSGQTVLPSLLTLIGRSHYADLRVYPDRQSAWAVLPVAVRPLFLEETAWGLLVHEQPEEANSLLEPELFQLFTSSSFTARALAHLSLTAGRAVRYVARFSAPESTLLSYLAAHRSQLDKRSAQDLGQLIERKGWKQAAQALLAQAQTEPSRYAALAYCLNQLDWLDRLKLRLQNPQILTAKATKQASTDWWAAVWQEASNLYPAGPTHQHLWESIGRKNYELSIASTGGEQWQQALNILRTRREHKQTAKLLHLMQEQHFWNNNLQFLATHHIYE